MARLDPVLQLLVEKDMEVLLLEPGRPPRLRKGSQEHLASKSDLSRGTIERLLSEIAPSGLLTGDNGASNARFDYQLEGRTLDFQLSRSGDGWTAVVAPGPAAELQAAGSVTKAETPAAPSETRTGKDKGGMTIGPFPSIRKLLELTLERDASDLHLGSRQVPRLRQSGDLEAIDDISAPTEDLLGTMLEEIMPERAKQQFRSSHDADFAFELGERARFRVNVFRDRLGVGAVFRQIPTEIPSLEELGLPDSLRRLGQLTKGLILVTGPTGSGKSTTLAALVDLINREQCNHIITIEDPIEFVHPSKGCLVNQREVGTHTESFKQALRAALREDPDVVLVGEMRDLETTAIALETAETGHLVFGTLHTTSAPSTIERIVDQYPSDRQGQIRMMLASSLKAVVSQTLLKRIGGGRVAALEVLYCTNAVSNLIREGKTFQIVSAMQTGRKIGMTTLNDSLAALVKDGIVEADEAYRKAIEKDSLVSKLAALGIEVPLVKVGATNDSSSASSG